MSRWMKEKENVMMITGQKKWCTKKVICIAFISTILPVTKNLLYYYTNNNIAHVYFKLTKISQLMTPTSYIFLHGKLTHFVRVCCQKATSRKKMSTINSLCVLVCSADFPHQTLKYVSLYPQSQLN